jgi:hypothetical protein
MAWWCAVSLPEDYRHCRNCGELTDSDVCSVDCGDALDEAQRQAIEHERVARGECPNCGEKACPTCDECHECLDVWTCRAAKAGGQ